MRTHIGEYEDTHRGVREEKEYEDTYIPEYEDT
jgi:hypothetical protein